MSLIDISNILTSGWTAAFHGMRNSRQSWDKSDSIFEEEMRNVIVGEKDLGLASKLAKLGGSNAKFRRMIHVSMDISAPLYWWKEFDTYKVGTTANSTSTMYSITDRDFTLEDFAMDDSMSGDCAATMFDVVETLNQLRRDYLNEKNPGLKKMFWKDIICLLPESYKQLRTVDMNYEVIAHIVKDRKGHRLKEWELFIEKMKELPYAKELIFEEGVEHDSNEREYAEDQETDAAAD